MTLSDVVATLAPVLEQTHTTSGRFCTLKDDALVCTFYLSHPLARSARQRARDTSTRWHVDVSIEVSTSDALIWLNRDRYKSTRLRTATRADLERALDRLLAWAQRQNAKWSVVLDVEHRIQVELALDPRFRDALDDEIQRSGRVVEYDLMTRDDALAWVAWLDRRKDAREARLNRDTLSREGRACT